VSEFGPLYDTATTALQVVVDAAAAAQVTLPTRQYVVPGLAAAYDCPQLTVTIQAVQVGVPGQAIGQPIANCQRLRYATYRVELLRKTPTQQGSAPPSVAKLDESAKEVLRDMEVIHGALLDQRAKIAGQGNPARGVGVPIAIGNATPIGAEGGLAGTRVDIDVPLQVFPTP
jgi:hypothetical protein